MKKIIPYIGILLLLVLTAVGAANIVLDMSVDDGAQTGGVQTVDNVIHSELDNSGQPSRTIAYKFINDIPLTSQEEKDYLKEEN